MEWIIMDSPFALEKEDEELNEVDVDRVLKQIHAHVTKMREELQILSGTVGKIDERTIHLDKGIDRLERQQDRQDAAQEKLRDRLDKVNWKIAAFAGGAATAASLVTWAFATWERVQHVVSGVN